ncbi:MAG: hypothetical protein J0G28_14530 [Afipia sp.]|nr:hypothetical protein [Afipia sp.]OJW65515.1 MAG: hypothetical protein BGO65_12370 [Afipia sp. 64-13]
MSENQKDTQRALAAAKAIIDGRDPFRDYASILVTAEHAFAATLLAVMDRDPRKAAAMLNEGLVQGIENRLALYASKGHAA